MNKKIITCKIHYLGDYINYQTFIKEILLPFHIKIYKKGYLEQEGLEFVFYGNDGISGKKYVDVWMHILNEIYPQFSFRAENKILIKYDIYILFAWTMNAQFYTLKKHDIRCFVDYCYQKAINNSETMPQYDIIILKRKMGKRADINNYDTNNVKGTISTARSNLIVKKHIVNNDELYQKIKTAFPTLSTLNIDTAQLSFLEKVYLFRNAKIVIAQHGAGLVNTLFMRPQSLIIEFVSPFWYFFSFPHQIAKELDLIHERPYIYNKLNRPIHIKSNIISKIIKIIGHYITD